MQIRFKKEHEKAVTPTKGTDHASGFDLTAIDIFRAGQYVEYDTGISVEIPIGYSGFIFPRSSISKQPEGIILRNCVGVIDPDYRGTIRFRFSLVHDDYMSKAVTPSYKVGDRVGQIVFLQTPEIELVETDELSETARGEGGFGSTDIRQKCWENLDCSDPEGDREIIEKIDRIVNPWNS